MGRPSKGWTLRKRKGRPYSVRFTVGGVEHEPGTGTYDRAEAERVAADLYSDAVRGHRRLARRASSRGQSLTESAGAWLTAVAPTIDPGTRGTYAMYAETHWASRWTTLEALTDASIAEYARARLRYVQASTVRKELSALRGFVAWCEETGRLASAPLVPSLPRRAVGTRHKQGRKGPPAELSPVEIKRLLRALPERAAERWGAYPVRAFFEFCYETSLRPATVERLSVPEHWKPGQRHIDIPPELDKARDGRPVPLTDAALAALARVAPESGIIFGAHDMRWTWSKAATKALGKAKAERFSRYGLRSMRITHWAEESPNLPGIQYLAGHASIATTAKYAKASLRAAKAVLKKR